MKISQKLESGNQFDGPSVIGRGVLEVSHRLDRFRGELERLRVVRIQRLGETALLDGAFAVPHLLERASQPAVGRRVLRIAPDDLGKDPRRLLRPPLAETGSGKFALERMRAGNRLPSSRLSTLAGSLYNLPGQKTPAMGGARG